MHKKYVEGQEPGQKRTRLYSYGVSLGASQLGLYLGKNPERAAQVLDGAALFSTPWSTTLKKGGVDFFYKDGYYGGGIPFNRLLGFKLNGLIRKSLPLMKEHMSEEDFAELSEAIYSKRADL